MKKSAPSLPLAALLAALSLAPAASVWAADPPTSASATPTPATSAASASSAAPAPQIDASAMALLKKVQAAMLAPTSYHAECWTTLTYDPVPGKDRTTRYEMATLTAEKPNLMRYDAWEMDVDAESKWMKPKAVPTYTFVSDGKTSWKQFGTTYRTDKRTAPGDLGTISEPWGGFYAAIDSPYGRTEYARKNDKQLEVRRDGSDAVEGVVCDKVFTHYVTPYGHESIDYRTTFYIGPDGLLRRQVQHVQFGEKPGFTRDATLRSIRTNFKIESPKTLFAYVAPQGVKSEAQEAADAPKLLAKGVVAPDFTAIDKDGVAVKLSDLKGKIVVIDFWASWCGPCNASMPHTQEVAKKLQAQNVPLVLLAVDDGEAQPAFAAWVKAHPELDAMRFVYSDQKADISGKSYHVSYIPTQYIIDAQGIVRTSFNGYGGPNDDLEKAIRAASEPLR